MSLGFLEIETVGISRQLVQEYDRVVNPTHWPPLPQGDIPGTHLCQNLSRPRCHSAAGGVCR